MRPVLYLITWLVFPGIPVSGQGADDYTDRIALQLPQPASYHVDSVSNYINRHFPSPPEKIRAVYTWIVRNIAYSRDSLFFFRNWEGDKDAKMNQLLRRRKGVCENYAELFVHLLQKCGITAIMVPGYVKAPGAGGTAGHGWAAVFRDGSWKLCDPTWDAGHQGGYRYYMTDPELFIETHMPFDPIWQLLEQPWSHQDFRNGYTKKRKTEPRFHYLDSISEYLKADSLQQLMLTARRLQQPSLENEDAGIWYKYSQMKIHIIHQEANRELFNGAVNDLNQAKQLFNEFVQFRNSRFTPPKTDEDIKRMFNRIEDLLDHAGHQLKGIGVASENYQYDTDGLQENLLRLLQRVQEQKAFLQRYFDCNPANRERLLYK